MMRLSLARRRRRGRNVEGYGAGGAQTNDDHIPGGKLVRRKGGVVVIPHTHYQRPPPHTHPHALPVKNSIFLCSVLCFFVNQLIAFPFGRWHHLWMSPGPNAHAGSFAVLPACALGRSKAQKPKRLHHRAPRCAYETRSPLLVCLNRPWGSQVLQISKSASKTHNPKSLVSTPSGR
jgi:hypothetical protein